METTNYTTDFIDMIHNFIVIKAYNYVYDKTKCEYMDSLETWKAFFKENNFLLLYYYELVLRTNDESNYFIVKQPIYTKNTFQEYVDSKANIITLGPYDYMDFCKKMKEDPGFKEDIQKKYIKNENLKSIKNGIIDKVRNIHLSNESFNIIPYYEYIAKNKINVEQKPEYANFRNNLFEFCEKYSLWDMKEVFDLSYIHCT
jgi:hypothetical protein